MSQDYAFKVASLCSGKRLDIWLQEQMADFSRSRLKALIEENHVTVNQKTQSPAYKVRDGDAVAIHVPSAVEAIPLPQVIPLDIIYEDEDLLVLNKNPGLVVHPGPGNPDQTLVNALLAYCVEGLSGIGGVKRPGIVHRLDKGTSGLMVVAKNDFTHRGLSEQFADRTLSRCYQALVWGQPVPAKGRIETAIGRCPHHRQKMAVLRHGGKVAITDYALIKVLTPQVSLVRCALQTGRTHQIRVHLTHLGHGLIGDMLYGRPPKGLNETLKNFSQALIEKERPLLHAYEIHFFHPRLEKNMQFEIPLPQDFLDVIDLLNPQI